MRIKTNPEAPTIKSNKNVNDDFVIRMELRQKERQEKKEKRRLQKMAKIEEEKQRIQEENRRIKANLDLEGVMLQDDTQHKSKNKIISKPNNINSMKNNDLEEFKNETDQNVVTSTNVQNVVQDMNNAKDNFDERLQVLRQQRDQCELDAQMYAQDVEKIREMVKKETEELANLDRIKKYQQIEKVWKRELEEEQKRLEQERIKAEKDIKLTRATKLFNTLDTIFKFEKRRKRKQVLNKLTLYSIDLENKIKKCEFLHNLRIIEKVYNSWHMWAHKSAQDKLFKQYQIEKKKEQVNYERAVYYDKRRQERKCFNCFKKFHILAQQEKEIEREHEEKMKKFMQVFIFYI